MYYHSTFFVVYARYREYHCSIKVQKHNMTVVNYDVQYMVILLVKLIAQSNSGTRLVDCILERKNKCSEVVRSTKRYLSEIRPLLTTASQLVHPELGM